MSKSLHHIVFRRELCAALALALPLSAFAAITPGAGGPTVTPGATPVVNIVAPKGQGGVSHNHFDAFNVDAHGVVLNNSVNSVKSQLAGQMDGNPRLSRAAQVIIAEVTGKTGTALNGATEIAGSKAALIIANPNGISADGASFINASRLILTTGVPKLDQIGLVDRIEVDQGVISVTGKGLDATGADRTQLLARSIEVNAKVQAKALEVNTGPKNKDYFWGGEGDRAGSGKAPPVALDVSARGSMYADSIILASTEKGVGVNVAGTLQAGTGQILIDATGPLSVAKSGVVKSSMGEISLQSKGSVNIAGQIQSEQGGVEAKADDAVNVAEFGSVKAGRHIYMRGNREINIAKTVESDGGVYLYSPRSIQIAESGVVKARCCVTLTTGHEFRNVIGDIVNVKGRVESTDGTLNIDASNLHNEGTLAGLNLSISADQVNNKGTLAAKRYLNVRGPGISAPESTEFVSTGTISAGARAYVTGYDHKLVKGTVQSGMGDFVLDEFGRRLRSGSDDYAGRDYKALWMW